MTTTVRTSKATMSRDAVVDLTAAPRAVISTAAGLLYMVGCSVLGAERFPTARDNAWAAVCADRERAKVRAEAMRLLSR